MLGVGLDGAAEEKPLFIHQTPPSLAALERETIPVVLSSCGKHKRTDEITARGRSRSRESRRQDDEMPSSLQFVPRKVRKTVRAPGTQGETGAGAQEQLDRKSVV